MNRTIARAAVLAVLGAAVSLPALPASALVVPIPIRVVVDAVPGGFDVCGYGVSTSSVNLWTLSVAGVRVYERVAIGESEAEGRSNGQATEKIINDTRTGSSPTFLSCLFVSEAGAPAGHFHATLTYTGAGPDVVAALPGFGTWAAGESGGTGTGLGAP